MPILTSLGRAWAAGSVALILLALLLASPLALTVASASVLGLLLDAVLTFPLGRRARKAGLELTWWISGTEERPPAVVGAKIPIEGQLRLHTSAHLRLASVEPIVDEALEVEVVDLPRELERGEPRAFRLVARPKTVGRHVLQGLATLASGPFGAFAVGLYFPHPLEVRVLPRSLTRTPRRSGGPAYERLEGSSRRSEAGSGADLHELRAHRPGDSLKAVAWKASAKRGRLLVREVEHEVQETHFVLLDLGGSMFSGRPGSRRIDRAIEEASSCARRLLDEGHRVGLVTFDARVLDVVAPADGKRQRIALLERLTDAVHVYDPARVDADDPSLARFVAAHLREHEARYFPVDSDRDRAALASHLAPRLMPLLPSGTPPRPRDVFLAYCRECGLRVRPKATAPEGARDAALAAATLRVLRGGSPTGVRLISDLDDIPVDGAAVGALRLLRRRGGLEIDVPEGATEAPRDSLERALVRARGRAEGLARARLTRAIERPASASEARA